jgi:hypothetical protein
MAKPDILTTNIHTLCMLSIRPVIVAEQASLPVGPLIISLPSDCNKQQSSFVHKGASFQLSLILRYLVFIGI